MTFFNRQREWYFYMEEIFSLNNNLLINNDVSLKGNLNVKNISSNVITSNNNIINENLWKQIILEDGFIYNLNSSYTPPYITNLVPYGSSITFSNSNRNIEFSSTTSINEYVGLSTNYYFYIPQQFFIQFTVDFNNELFFNFYENAETTTTALNYQGNTLTYIDRLGTTIIYNLIIQTTETIIIWYDTTLLNIYKLTASNLEKIASIDNFYSGEYFWSGNPKNMNFKIGGSMGTSIRNLYINNYSPYFKFIEEFEYNLNNNQLLITNDINIKSNLFIENKINFFNDQNTINITTHRKNIIPENSTRNSIEIGHQYYRNHSRFSTTYQKKDFINIGFYSNAYISNTHTAQNYNPINSPEKTIIIGNYNCEFFKGGSGSNSYNNVILGFNCFSGPDNIMVNTVNNVVIGTNCGYNMKNASEVVLIGMDTGYNKESSNQNISETRSSIAIGYRAGYNKLHSKCIILNGDNSSLDSNQENSFYVHPIRSAAGSAGMLQYDSSTKEVTYSNDLSANTITATTFFGDGSQLTGITDTTYTAGSNMLLNGTQFNIPQSIRTNDNVQFNQVTASSFIGNGYQLFGINQIDRGGDGGNGYVFIDNAGNITIENIRYWNYANNTSRGIININADYQVRIHGSFLASSDNRLKHNEIDISNALSTIRQLKAQKYQKTNKMKEADYIGDLSNVDWVYEAGFIAQDILKISNLEYVVGGGDYIDHSGNEIIEKYYLNYNDIFVYNVAATQELDLIVQQQKNEINYLKDKNLELENKVDLLKNKLNELLSESGKETIIF